MSSSRLSTYLALGFCHCKRAIASTIPQGLMPQRCYLPGEKKPLCLTRSSYFGYATITLMSPFA
jgi:hypothetical protein